MWFIKNYIFPPKIRFGREILKVPCNGSEMRYVFLFENTGWRKLIDLSVNATVVIPGIVDWDNESLQYYRVVTTADRKHLLETGVSTTARISLEDSPEVLTSRFVPSDIKTKISEHNNSLEELLKLHNDATIQISIFGNDNLTGVRKLFESKEYLIGDIKEGEFNRKKFLVQKKVS